MNLAEQVKEKCLALETALSEQNPRMPILLREIHTILKSDPEVVTLLDESDIAIVVSGLKRQTNTEIATTTAKSKTKSVKSIGLADL